MLTVGKEHKCNVCGKDLEGEQLHQLSLGGDIFYAYTFVFTTNDGHTFGKRIGGRGLVLETCPNRQQ
jgi:hypothetical protein